MTGDLKQLASESARILRRRLIVGIVGSLAGTVLGCIGLSTCIGNNAALGAVMLLCAAGAFCFVGSVRRDCRVTNDVVARKSKQLENQIAARQTLDDQRMLAAQHGLDRIAVELYLKEISYYPSWIHHSRGRVPARIREALKTAADTVKIKTGSAEYLFDWECTHMDNGCDRGELTLWVDDSIVLRVGSVLSRDQWLTSASSYQVLALVEGRWVEELFAISTESKECLQKHRVEQSSVSQR
jgi:hypothetical protein